MTSHTESRSGSRTSAGRAGPSLKGRKRPVETAIVWSLRLSALLTVLTTLGILFALLLPALGFFREVSIGDFLFGTRWAPRFEPATFGVIPLITATLWTTAIALFVAVPIGLGAAMLLSEYASPRLRKILKPILEILAGVPTIVYGLFALT
ncbi:PstC family ABC transporter permease, partial [Intrasporangium sp.]|uniref:PstC family ABC transporter permease n=1 Tax=Intrasporangium sp. TaxID=1925024 RepID=UPI00293B64DF|nr:phosphate ABC transporter permease subunit PstC [Intrasporangium sp.]